MKHQTKAILGGLMGNVVEAYDASICYFLSHELSKELLGDSKGRPTVFLALFFLAYLAKPIGAFFLGLFSDRYGRKNVLMGSILIMGIATVFIGTIPSYHSIGFMSAVLLLVFRTLQSMALGSEFLNSASFLVESGNNAKRGFRGCWPSVGVKLGYLIACCVVEFTHFIGSYYFPDENWLWRIPFLLALLTTVVGVYIRFSMPESLAYVIYYAERVKPTTKEIYLQSKDYIKKNPFMFNYAFFSSFLSVGIGFFFYLYIPLHAMQYSHFSRGFIINTTMASLAAVSIIIPFFGWLSDERDRLKMLAFATGGLFLLVYPFMYIVNYGNATSFILMQLLITIPCACYYSVSSVILTELFPLPIRCTALSIVYSVSASLASGLPPLLSDYLVRKTGLPSSPCLIIMVISFLVMVNIALLAKRYRLQKNSYKVSSIQDGDLFKIYYQRPILP